MSFAVHKLSIFLSFYVPLIRSLSNIIVDNIDLSVDT